MNTSRADNTQAEIPLKWTQLPPENPAANGSTAEKGPAAV
jgi:hypothetical protein